MALLIFPELILATFKNRDGTPGYNRGVDLLAFKQRWSVFLALRGSFTFESANH